MKYMLPSPFCKGSSYKGWFHDVTWRLLTLTRTVRSGIDLHIFSSALAASVHQSFFVYVCIADCA